MTSLLRAGVAALALFGGVAAAQTATETTTTTTAPAVPPPVTGWRRHVLILGRHHLHVGTTGPLGPDMLAVWQTRSRRTARVRTAPRCRFPTPAHP